MKRIWITSLSGSEDAVKPLPAELKTYGIEAGAHLWVDDVEKAAWIEAREVLVDPRTALWAILGSGEAFSTPSVRYGLALLAITVQAKRGRGFPVALFVSGGAAPPADTLPTPLKGAQVTALQGASPAAKIVARLHSAPPAAALADYRIEVHASPTLGTWFEAGPVEAPWEGAMAGIAGPAEITFQAVGPRGSLPERSVLSYPVKGMQLALRERSYLAWAVQNRLDSEASYFFKVQGTADSILFGPYGAGESAKVFVMDF
ncbi:hypothetical protein [Desulfatiglans anilini]|uniref:hypothetical protein n=1 Tax=Desulfatiglans anilini TaxID=90728 RepID=UPI0004257363|nr:hypothetical protein [Desulfatiglans anilini]